MVWVGLPSPRSSEFYTKLWGELQWEVSELGSPINKCGRARALSHPAASASAPSPKASLAAPSSASLG